MKISNDRVKQIDADAPRFGYRVPRVSLDHQIRNARSVVKNQIETHHQGPFLVFEEAVRFIVAFESFQYSRTDRPKEATPFVLLLSRVRADLISIHQLLQAGQESSAHAIARVFFEDIELAMATAADPNFAMRYMDAESSDSFWAKNVAYGKIYPLVKKFFELGKPAAKISELHIAHHKAMKSFLSQHIHPTFNSAFNLVAPSAIEAPGMFANRPIGWFGEGSARLCIYIADEIQAFSATCINSFIKPAPPPVFANYKPCKELSTFMRPAHNLQTLLGKYSARMHSSYEKRRSKWEMAFDSDEVAQP